MEIEAKLSIKVPKVPNFILYAESDGKVSIGDLTDEQLTEIAEAWKADLLKRAAQIRAAD